MTVSGPDLGGAGGDVLANLLTVDSITQVQLRGLTKTIRQKQRKDLGGGSLRRENSLGTIKMM